MKKAFCRQSGGDCFPQILGSSTSCQVEQQRLPNITTYRSLARARTPSQEQARCTAKRTDFAWPYAAPPEYEQYGMAWEMSRCPSGIPDLASRNFSIFFSCRSSQSEVKSLNKTVGYAKRSFFLTFLKAFCG